MQEFKTKTKLVYWPTPQDYNEAVQNLHVNAHDSELRGSAIDIGPLGIPRVISGSFASVYKVHSSGRDLAVRCFLRDVPDARWRYSRISQFVENDRLPYTVSFDYQPQGIRVVGEWFPIVKMEWIAGQTLDNHLRSLNGKFTSDFADRFKKMCWDLSDAGIAHGDLQHGNIIVKEDQLFLVDYDGMYVPSMQGARSNELGHRNYQHPARNAQHFGPYLDNFSAWVIYGSLKALSVDASLFQKLGAGEDCLLFRREDFTNPMHSCAFAALEGHADETLRKLGRYIRWCLSLSPDQVPNLGSKLDIDVALPSLNPNTPTERAEGFADSQAHHLDSNGHWYRTSASDTLSNETQSTSNWTTSSPKKTPPSPRIEHELRQHSPRKTKFNRSCKRLSPMIWQCLNLFNPVVFLAFGAFVSLQQDHDLARHGIDIPGIVESSRIVHHSKGPDRREVNYTYRYNNVEHQKSTEVPLSEDISYNKPITVKILLKDPQVSSPNLNPQGGPGESELPREIMAQQANLFLYFIAWLMFETMLWLRPLSHKRIIARGTAVRGRITGKQVRNRGKRSQIYQVFYDYERPTAHNQTTSSNMKVSKKQYDDISEGEEATIVYLPGSSADVIYRFSYYRAV